MRLRTGATLQSGKYLLNQVLGSGEGIGMTFLATQTLLNQRVVIKTLAPTLQLSHNFVNLRDRFVQEARILARIQHPSVVRVLDFFHEGELPFLVMEHVSGKSLAGYLTDSGKFAEAEAVHYIRQVGAALHLAHQNGLLHRNLRPASIIRRAGTNLGVLVGFGLAHELVSAQDKDDLHALAATLYALLSGRTPTANLLIDAAPWSPTTKQAILLGLKFDGASGQRLIEEWLRLLPNTTLPLIGAVPPPPLMRDPREQGTGSREQETGNREQETAMAADRRVGAPHGNGKTGSPNENERTTGLPGVPESPAATIALQTPKPPTSRPVTQQPMAAYSGNRHLPKFLVLTIAATGAMGAGFGLALRISAAKAPGTGILHPSQTFSERKWKGTLTPDQEQGSGPVEKALGDFHSKPAPKVSESGIPKPPAGWGQEAIPAAPIVPSSPEYEPPLAPEIVTPRQDEPVPATAPETVNSDPEPYSPAPIAPRPRSPVVPAPVAPVPPGVAPDPAPPGAPLPPSGEREIDPAPPVTSRAGAKKP